MLAVNLPLTIGRYGARVSRVHAILGLCAPRRNTGGGDSHGRMDHPKKELTPQGLTFDQRLGIRQPRRDVVYWLALSRRRAAGQPLVKKAAFIPGPAHEDSKPMDRFPKRAMIPFAVPTGVITSLSIWAPTWGWSARTKRDRFGSARS